MLNEIYPIIDQPWSVIEAETSEDGAPVPCSFSEPQADDAIEVYIDVR